MGIISDFVSGAAQGAGEGLDIERKAKLTREMNEANFRRDTSMKRLLAGEEREFQRGESELERKSREKIATGKPLKAPAVKDFIVGTDEYGEEIKETRVWNQESGKFEPYDMGIGDGVQISEDQAQSMAQDEYDSKSKYFTSDQAQFGMSEPEWVNKRMLEIMGGKAAGAAPTPTGTKAPTRKPPTETEFLSRVKNRAREKGVIYNEDEAKEAYRRRIGGKPKITAKPTKKKGIIERGKGDIAASAIARQQQTGVESKRAERESTQAKLREDYQRKFKAMPDSQKRVWWRKNAASLRKNHSKEYREGRKIMERLTRKRSVQQTFKESRVQ